MLAAGNFGAKTANARQLRSQPVTRTVASPVVRPVGRGATLVVRADNGRSSDSFLAGFLVGGAVFGTLGFIFAPQISKALLGDDQRLKMPRFLEDEAPKDPERTKQDLIEKIAQLNASIDDVAAQLKVKEADTVKVESTV